MQMNPPAHAYRDGQAYVVLSNPGAEQVVIWSLLVERGAWAWPWHKDAQTFVADLAGRPGMSRRSARKEFEKVSNELVSKKKPLSQWQMKLEL